MQTRWDKLKTATLDAPAREEVARLIREERAGEPILERAGMVVEFSRAGQLMCGYVESCEDVFPLESGGSGPEQSLQASRL